MVATFRAVILNEVKDLTQTDLITLVEQSVLQTSIERSLASLGMTMQATLRGLELAQ